MNVLTVLLLATAIFFLTGCGEKSQSDKSDTSAVPTVTDEVTKLGEIPSFIGEGLTPEEKAEYQKKFKEKGV